MSPSTDQTPSGGAAHGPFLPLLLFACAFLGWMTLQTTELLRDRHALQDASAQQAVPLANGYTIRKAADSLAAKVQKLAAKGNPDAEIVLTQLRDRGITINPNATTAAPP